MKKLDLSCLWWQLLDIDILNQNLYFFLVWLVKFFYGDLEGPYNINKKAC